MSAKWANDWTDIQDEIENYAGQTLGQANPVSYFFDPQYGALSAWGTIAKSNYHGFSASLRQRIHNLQWDLTILTRIPWTMLRDSRLASVYEIAATISAMI